MIVIGPKSERHAQLIRIGSKVKVISTEIGYIKKGSIGKVTDIVIHDGHTCVKVLFDKSSQVFYPDHIEEVEQDES